MNHNMNHATKTLTIKGMLVISGIVLAAAGLLSMWSTSQVVLATSGSTGSAADTEGTSAAGAGAILGSSSGSATSAGSGPSGSAGGEIVLCKSEALVTIAIGGSCSGSNPG